MPDQTPYLLPSVTAAKAMQMKADGARFVDLRKPQARIASGHTVDNAEVRDPYCFGHDDPLTTFESPIITFCVHGHEVSQYGCALLLLHGRDAAYVEGGFSALIQASAPLQSLVI